MYAAFFNYLVHNIRLYLASAPLRFEFDVAVSGPNGVEIHVPTLDWPDEIMVPEPSAVLLAGLACGSALLLRRRTI